MDKKKSTRDKLIELLKKWEINSPHFYHKESIADLLIESGLVVDEKVNTYERLTDKDWHITKELDMKDDFPTKRAKLCKLWDLENKIENGTLMELPCKIGDTVYCLNCWGELGFIHGAIFTAKAVAFYFSKDSGLEIRVQSDIHKQNYYLKYGDVVFITREDAEKRLKEVEGEG